MQLVPLVLYIGAFAAYVWHFARRQPAVEEELQLAWVSGCMLPSL